jgi:molybdopterin/thiamine biosynthesis adenylyltransferase
LPDVDESPVRAAVASADGADRQVRWAYDEAFKRNRGLISEEEQEKLRNSRIAIAGMGGVGGVHLITLARMGVGKFTIADPDVFEVANFNRQYGATISNLGRNKAEAMAHVALDINPELDLRVIPRAVDEKNVDDFLDGADLFVDGLDFFAIDARRLVFRRAAERDIWAITAGPIGFSAAWISFDPNGMAFDDYFDLHDTMDTVDELVAFAVGLTPRATHLAYTDFSAVSIADHTGPSASLACRLASGVLAAEATKIVTGKGHVRPAPAFHQFDAYAGCLRSGRLRNGNRSLFQRFKRAMLKRKLAALGVSTR